MQTQAGTHNDVGEPVAGFDIDASSKSSAATEQEIPDQSAVMPPSESTSSSNASTKNVGNSLTTIAAQPLAVLVVDDSSALRSTMQLLLEQHGCSVCTAPGGEDALAQIQHRYNTQQAMFSVILCDVHMEPHMGGYAMTSTLRDWESSFPTGTKPPQPVVLMSGDASDVAIQEGYRVGANAYISKPAELDELLRVMRVAVLHAGGVSSSSFAATWQPSKAVKHPLESSVVLQSGSASHSSIAIAQPVGAELFASLRPVYGPDIESLIDDVIHDIQAALVELKSKSGRAKQPSAHKLKGLFGVLFLKDAFDECGMIEDSCRNELDGSESDIDLRIQNVCSLLEKSLSGEILPERKRFEIPRNKSFTNR